MGGQAAPLDIWTDDGVNFRGASLFADKEAADNAKTTSFVNNQNRPDIANPYGATNWNADGTAVDQSFSGPLNSAAGSLQQNYATALRQPMNGDTARAQAIQNATSQTTARMDPQWTARETQMKQRLAGQGMDPNSPQYAAAMSDFSKQKDDAYSSTRNMAIGRGAQDSGSIFKNSTAERMGQLQQMQQMMELLRAPKFNLAQKRPDMQRLRAKEDANNYQMGAAANAASNTTDAINGGVQFTNSLSNIARG